MRYVPLVILSALVIAASCHNPTATGVSVDSALRPLIPPDTTALAAVDLDKLKDSAFYQRHQRELNATFLDAISERVGLDPRRDLADILIAWNGKQPVVVARGRFSTDTLEPRLASLGMRRTRYKSYTLFGDDRGAIAFVMRGIAVAGPLDAVRGELNLASHGRSGVPEDFRTLLAAVPKGDQFWAVSSGEMAITQMPMASDVESALSNIAGYISSASMGIGFDSGTHLAAQFNCISGQGAQRVRDALRGGIGLARLTTQDNAWDLLKLYDSIQVSQDQQTIRVNADLSADLTDKLLAHLPQLRNRAGEMLRDR